jgi:hypothetical protein
MRDAFDFGSIFRTEAQEKAEVLTEVLSKSDVPISTALRLAQLMGCTLTVNVETKKEEKSPPAKDPAA